MPFRETLRHSWNGQARRLGLPAFLQHQTAYLPYQVLVLCIARVFSCSGNFLLCKKRKKEKITKVISKNVHVSSQILQKSMCALKFKCAFIFYLHAAMMQSKLQFVDTVQLARQTSTINYSIVFDENTRCALLNSSESGTRNFKSMYLFLYRSAIFLFHYHTFLVNFVGVSINVVATLLVTINIV